jgi:CubicO group peptidase (beta-lactamase class C family)
MVSLLLGIAVQEGKIASINDKVINYFPAFEVGPYTNEITFRHLVTTSSGIAAKKYGSNYSNPGNMAPGIDARYHNDHFDQLAIALTYIYQQPLVVVLRDRVLSKTGGTVEWRADGEVALSDGRRIPVNAGYAFTSWSAADLARIGWLFLNKGNWNGDQIINAQYVADCRTPLDIPVMVSSGNRPVVVDTKSTYGYGWRGTRVDDAGVLWHMSGNGGQFCAVIPELRLVFVKINGYSEQYKPYRGIGLFKDALLNIRSEGVSASASGH